MLLRPKLTALPELQELRQIREAGPPVRLPVAHWLANRFSTEATLMPTAAEFIERESLSKAWTLSGSLSACLQWEWVAGGEQHTLLAVEALLITPLRALDKLAPPDAMLRLTKLRDAADSSTGMTRSSSNGKPLRPDLQLRAGDGRLIFKGEDKASNLDAAVKDLGDKTLVWSPLVYGSLPYLLCYAAGGPRLQLYAIPRTAPRAPVPITRIFDMSLEQDRVPLLCCAVQLHRLLQAVSLALPPNPLLMDQELVHQHERADGLLTWKRIVVLETATMTAIKSVRGWESYCADMGVSIEVMQKAYACPRPFGGLVCAVKPPVVHGLKYSVRMKPLGLTGRDAQPRSEDELRMAAHGLLHGLDALHAAGLVHRDVRLDNVARCERGKYFLIDLEACARAGAAPPHDRHLRCWDSHTLEAPPGGHAPVYTCASDVHLLARLLLDAASTLVVSDEGRRFLARLSVRDAAARPTAVEALEDGWIGCTGVACVEAGAFPT